MIERLGAWLDSRIFALAGLGLGIWETVYGDARIVVYGFCLMLISPAFANVADRLLTGRTGNGRSSDGKGD